MRKLVLFAAILAILGAYGCNEDNVYNPDMDTNGRVIGSIHGVASDGADGTLLPGVQVTTNVRGTTLTTTTDAVGHYAFTDLDPGTYVLTFVFPAKGIQEAYTTVTGKATVPTLDALPGILDVPTGEDFPYEVDGNVELFPLIGSTEGYVMVQTDAMTQVPAASVSVVADFLYPTDNITDLFDLAIAGNEWTATTDADGHYAMTGLPTGTNGDLRTLPYMYNDTVFNSMTTDLDMREGGNWLAQPMVFGAYSGLYIVSQNFDNNVPFAPGDSFVATFSAPMDPATFTATVDGDAMKVLLPINVSWSGNTVTVDPVNDLIAGDVVRLTLSGWSLDGETYTNSWLSIDIVDPVGPSVIATNFNGSNTFLVDGNLEVTFNMAMDPASFDITFVSGQFDTSWNADNTVLTIDPEVDLGFNTYYTITLNGNAANGMALVKSFNFTTIPLETIIITDTNFMASFDSGADLWFMFSEPMEADMDITVTQGGAPFALENTVWSEGGTKLTLTPVVPMEKGTSYTVTLDGMGTNGYSFSYGPQAYTSAIGDAPFIVTHNMVDGEFPVDGIINVLFNKAMDTASVEVTFNGAGPNPLYGVTTWTDDMNLVFTPDPELLPSQSYTFNIQGDAQDGGHMNTTVNFDTIGGIDMVWNNIMQLDGGYANFPVAGAIELRFNMTLDLNAPGTSIVLTRESIEGVAIPPVEVLISYATTEDGKLLTVTPDQTMQKNTTYRITWTVGSELLADTTTGNIVFTTEVVPPLPVDPVANFALDATWAGNFNTTSITFTWDRDANASGYFIYAREADAAKDDFLRVASVSQPLTDTVTATVDLSSANNAAFSTIFDTRSDDTPQTPFEGRDVLFRITAANNLGEGIVSTDVAVSDVFGPNGAFTGQDVSADDVADVDATDTVVLVTFDADEYLDWNTVPVVTITENDLVANDWGDPAYIGTLGTPYMEDQDGFTRIFVPVTITDGNNGAGDYVGISGFLDTSGNPVDAATVIADYQLTDGTNPTGTFADPGVSADNSAGIAPVTFTLTFTASELLDETVPPVVAIVDNAISDVPNYLGTYTYSVVGGVSVIELDMALNTGVNAVEDQVAIYGLTDLAGNVLPVGDAVVYEMVDTTAPGGSWTAQSASAQNDGASDIVITVTFSGSEFLDNTVAPTFSITDGGYVGVAVDANVVAFADVGNVTTVTFDVTVPAGYNGMDDIISVNGLSDRYGNVMATAIDGVLTDTTAPVPPTNLVTTAGLDSPAFVDLAWDANNVEADFVGYNVFRSLTGLLGSFTQVNATMVATNAYTDNDPTLVLGTIYYYVVTAIDGAPVPNDSDPSNVDSATPVDTTGPAAPTGLLANGGEGSPAYVDLGWDANNVEADFDHYDVYRNTVNNFGSASQINGSAVVTQTYHDADGALVLGTNYYYWIVAVDVSGNNSLQSNNSSTAPVDTNPAVPTGLADAGGSVAGVLNVTWTENTEPDLDHYIVYYNSATPATGGTAANVPAPASTFSVSGLAAGTWYVNIEAVDGTPNSSGTATEITVVVP